MLRKIAMTALGLAALCASAAAQAADAPFNAQEFVTKASISSRFEVDTSRMALNRTQKQDVKEFAQRMVDDHMKMTDKLQDVLKVSKSGAKPSSELDTEHQKKLSKLNETENNEFDRAYLALQTTAHEDAVKLFSQYAEEGDDSELKHFASGELPKLKEHLQHVQRLNAEQ